MCSGGEANAITYGCTATNNKPPVMRGNGVTSKLRPGNSGRTMSFELALVNGFHDASVNTMKRNGTESDNTARRCWSILCTIGSTTRGADSATQHGQTQSNHNIAVRQRQTYREVSHACGSTSLVGVHIAASNVENLVQTG